jgi:hypothetical protein
VERREDFDGVLMRDAERGVVHPKQFLEFMEI